MLMRTTPLYATLKLYIGYVFVTRGGWRQICMLSTGSACHRVGGGGEVFKGMTSWITVAADCDRQITYRTL